MNYRVSSREIRSGRTRKKLTCWVAVTLACLDIIPLASEVVRASPALMTLQLDKGLQVDKWFLDLKKTPRWDKDVKVAVLQKMRHAELNKQWDQCVRRVLEARALLPSENGWLSVQELRCRRQETAENSKRRKRLSQVVQRIEGDERVFARGTHVEALRLELFDSQILLVETEASQNPKRAWQNLEQLLRRLASWDRNQRAVLMRWAGQLAATEKRWEIAAHYFERSLNEVEVPEVRKSWLNALAMIPSDKKSVGADRPEELVAPPLPGQIEGNGFSPQGLSLEEGELVEKLRGALGGTKAKDALRAAYHHLRKFPGSGRAKWTSEQVSDLLVKNLRGGGNKKDEELAAIVRDLATLPPEFLTGWVKALHFASLYVETLDLCEPAVDKWDRHPSTGELVYWCGRSARNVDDLGKAIKYFQLAQTQRADTSLGREATLHLGMVFFRQKEWKMASSQFHQLAMQNGTEQEVDMVARYWLWRSLQKLDLTEQAGRAAKDLIQRYPLTYYGLRARWEMGSFNKEWVGREERNKKIHSRQVKIWLSAEERRIWNRCHLFLRSGWLEAATAEWDSFKLLGGTDGRLLSVAVEETLFRYPKAMSLAAKTINEELPAWRGYLFSVLFPLEYHESVASYSKQYDLDPDLVHALIKQESAYNPRAKSSAQAMGLMQLIPPTAREVAENLRVENLAIPEDLYDHRTNIQFGTYYLARMLRFAGGHVPLALAAYNAGPGRVGRWLSSRPGLTGLRERRSSAPEDEMWIDELPWPETRNYVRRILRNIIMYRAIYDQELNLPEPIWDSGPMEVAKRGR